MSAETSPISDISGAATGSAATPKKPAQAKRIDVASAPMGTEPKKPSKEGELPNFTPIDVTKFFEESRERLKEAFDQANSRFDTLRGAARDASNVCRESQVACLSGLKELNEHVFDLVQSEIDRSHDFLRSASEVEGVSELVQLQADYLRDSMETQAEQAKAFAELATSLFKATFEPLQHGFSTALENARKR